MADFSKYLIKKYKYWSVYLHPNQNLLGRCIVWCNRKSALDFSDASFEELKELLNIVKKLKKTCKKLFNPDWFNYTFLGNKTPHLHLHFVPRYKEKRIFEDFVFEDKHFGKHYQTDPNFKTPEKITKKLIKLYKKYLNYEG